MTDLDLSAGLVPESPRSRRRSYDEIVERHARRTGLEPELVRAVIGQESSGNPGAVSPKGARGLMQLMPATAKRFGVGNIHDPEENIRGGTDYLRFLSDRYKGNRDLILAGYNAGEGAVDKFGGIPPYRETRDYVKRINARLGGQAKTQQKQPPKIDLSAGFEDDDLAAGLEDSGQTPPRTPRVGQPSATPKQSRAPSVPEQRYGGIFGRPEVRQAVQRAQPSPAEQALRKLTEQANQITQQVQQSQPSPQDSALARFGVPQAERQRIQQTQEKEAAEGQLRQQRLEPQIERLTEEYRKHIRTAQNRGIGPEQWLNETAAKGAAGLTELVASIVRSSGPNPLAVGSESAADSLAAHAQALQRAAEAEGADRNVVSRTVQDALAGFISTAPEMAAMSLGAPAIPVFAAGSAARSYGRGERAPQVIGSGLHGAATGAAFEIPVSPSITSTLGRTAAKAGTTGAATTGIELATGAPPEQAVAAGITNAAFAGYGQLKRGGRRARKVETQPDVPAQPETVKPAVERVVETGPVERPEGVGVEGVRVAPAETPRQWQHSDFGLVTESPNQKRVGKNRVRVIAEDGTPHVIKRAALTGAGNQRAIPVKEPPAPNLESGIVETSAPPIRPLEAPQGLPESANRISAETTAAGFKSDLSLSQFVRKMGGIAPSEMYRGELDRIRTKESGTTGLINRRAKQGNVRQTADIMMQAANDAGFRDPATGRPFENPGDFLMAVERDVAGAKIRVRTGDEDFSVREAEYYAEQEARVRAEDARVELLEGGRGAELYDRIEEGKASDAERQEFRNLARERGLSELEIEDIISGDRETFAELEGTRSQGRETPPAARPAEQLGFVQEGLTQQEASRPDSKTPLRDRLVREQRERDIAADPERAAAQARLDEIKRRGMTVDDYARQPDLTGKVPSAQEVRLLREMERGGQASVPDQPALPTERSPEIEARVDRIIKELSDTPQGRTAQFLADEAGGLSLDKFKRAFKGKPSTPVPENVELAAKRYGELADRMLDLNLKLGDAGGPSSRLSKAEVDALRREHQKVLAKMMNVEKFITDRGYKVNYLGEAAKPDESFPSSRRDRPLIEKLKAFFRDEEGSLDLDKLRERARQLLRENPDITDEMLKVRLTEPMKFGPGTMRAGEPLPEVKERKFGKRFVEDERIAEEIRETIGTAKYYEPIPEKVTAKNARELIDQRGIAESMQIIRDEKNDIPFHVRNVMGQIVIQRLNRAYKNLKETNPKEADLVLNQANEMAEHLMEYGTRLGQGVQAFAQWARQTPEGILLTYKKAARTARERQLKLYATDVRQIVDTLNKPGMTDAERVQALKDLFGTNKTARKVKSEFDKILEAAKSGKLTDTLFYEIVGDKLGLPGYNKETAHRIADLAMQIEAAPEGLPKDKLLKELANLIAKEKGFDPSDLPIGIFYTHILSGYNTHAVNLADTGLNVLSEINGLAMSEPRAAARLYSGLLRGLNEGKFDALLALTKGRMFHDSKWLDAGGLMEVAKFGQKGGVPIKTETRAGRFAKRVAESKIAVPLNAYKYVTRAMAAADAVNARGAQEARATLLAYRMAKAEGLKGADFENRVREILALDRMADFEAQAKREGFTGADARYRAQELRDMVRDKDLMGDAREFAGEATYNHKPHGTLGLFAQNMQHLSSRVKPLKLFVPFTQIVANVTNRGLNWTPYGYKRALAGWGFGDFHEPITGEARRAMLVRATAGTAGMVMLGVLQEAGVLKIHGNGPSDKEKRRQLQNAGWRPYSIQIGDKYISYVYSPVGLGLSIAGNMTDSQRYHELEQKDAATRAAYAVARLGSTVFSQSFLSGLSRLFGALSEEPGKSITSVKQTLGGTVAAMTTPNIARDIYRLFDNKAYQSNTLMEDLVRNTPFAITGIPGAMGPLKPALNAFGEPVRLQRQRFFDIQSSDPAWRFVIEKGLRVPVPGRTIEMEKGRRITPEEYYDLLKTSGPKVREWILKNRTRLSRMKEQDAQDELSEAATRIRKFELVKLKMKVRKKAA